MVVVNIGMPQACDVCPMRCSIVESKGVLRGDRRETGCPIIGEVDEESVFVIKLAEVKSEHH